VDINESLLLTHLINKIPSVYGIVKVSLETQESMTYANLKSKMSNHFVTNVANKVKKDQCLAVSFNGYCNWCGKYGHKETECLVKKMVEVERDLLIMETNWAGMSGYLATPTMALAKAGALVTDGDMEAVEAVMDVAVAKDCTAEMVVVIVGAQITGEIHAPRIKRSILTHACWQPRKHMKVVWNHKHLL
jgi:hypothetical protein